MKRYRVMNGNVHKKLSDARNEAESLMASLHDDDSVYIQLEYDDGNVRFWEPYCRIERQGNRFVMKRD